MRELASDQPVEQAATLEDVRAEVLAPDRLNTVVFGIFAAVALAISVVGVAGVLAFSVSGRMHEFGIRLAIGAKPSAILDRRAHAAVRSSRWPASPRAASEVSSWRGWPPACSTGAAAGTAADRRRRGAAADRRAGRIADPRGTGCPRGRDPRVADGVERPPGTDVVLHDTRVVLTF